jgi:prolyl oligopeptidase
VRDFIACAEYLLREKFTSPAHLAGQGQSAGGIVIGRSITERPDLFGAAVSDRGGLNMLRLETEPNGPPNVPEFGSVKTLEGFKGLLAMDAYHHVKDATAYPAVLLLIGINDAQVTPANSAKMAARLPAATTSGKPVLLRVDYDAGHNFSTQNQRVDELADTWAFLLWQLGGGTPPARSIAR